MAKKSSKKDIESDISKTEEKKVDTKKEEKSLLGKDVLIKIGQAEYLGKCTSERKTNSGDQVYLQLNGCVSRWFNVDDIAEVK